MAFGNMTNAVAGAVASAAANNVIISNVENLDTRLDSAEATIADTATSPGGIGNQRLADRFGSTVGTGSNVTTGSASSQLTDIRSRLDTGVGTGSNVTTGSATAQLTDLRTRATNLEAGSTFPMVRVMRVIGGGVGNDVNTTQNAYTFVPWNTAPRNASTMWAVGNPTRLTVPAGQGGLYHVCGIILVWCDTLAYAKAVKTVGVRVSGTTILRAGGPLYGETTGNYHEIPVNLYAELTAAQYIEIGLWHNEVVSGPATGIRLVSDNSANPQIVMRKVSN